MKPADVVPNPPSEPTTGSELSHALDGTHEYCDLLATWSINQGKKRVGDGDLVGALRSYLEALESQPNFSSQLFPHIREICLVLGDLESARLLECQVISDILIENVLDQKPITAELSDLTVSYWLPSRAVEGVESAVIAGGRAMADCFSSAIFTSRNELLRQLSTGNCMLAAASRRPFPRLSFRNPIVVISSAYPRNYFHWMVEGIGRLLLARSADLPADTKYLVWSAAHKFQHDSLSLLGIPTTDTILASASPHVYSPLLIIPPVWTHYQGVTLSPSPGYSLHPHAKPVPEWLPSVLQQAYVHAFNRKASDFPKRLLIRRKAGVRRVENFDKLEEALKPLGFVSVALEDLPLIEQMQMFYGVEAVVGSHGAGLTNLLFSQPGTAIIELHAGVINPLYAELSAVAGHRHRSVLSTVDLSAGKFGGQDAVQFQVDCAAVLGSLAELGITA